MKFALLIATALLVAACQPYKEDPSSVEQRHQAATQARLAAKVPPPQIDRPIVRQMLTKRLQRLNAQNMQGYVYLLTTTGAVVAFYPINGTIVALNSYLSGDVRPAYFGGSERCKNGQDDEGKSCSSGGPGWEMVESPDYDGTYGKNMDGIFFFTADTDAYVEWYGPYLFSDQPLQLSAPPIMVRNLPPDEHRATP